MPSFRHCRPATRSRSAALAASASASASRAPAATLRPAIRSKSPPSVCPTSSPAKSYATWSTPKPRMIGQGAGLRKQADETRELESRRHQIGAKRERPSGVNPSTRAEGAFAHAASTDDAHHPAAESMLRPVRKERLRLAVRAAVRRRNRLRRQSGIQQLPTVRLDQVQVQVGAYIAMPGRPRGEDQVWILFLHRVRIVNL